MGFHFSLSWLGRATLWFVPGGAALLDPQLPQPPQSTLQTPPGKPRLCKNYHSGFGCRSAHGVIDWDRNNASATKGLCDGCAQDESPKKTQRMESHRKAASLAG